MTTKRQIGGSSRSELLAKADIALADLLDAIPKESCAQEKLLLAEAAKLLAGIRENFSVVEQVTGPSWRLRSMAPAGTVD